MKILLPKRLLHVRSALEHRHEREIRAATQQMTNKRANKMERVHTPTGAAVQTTIVHARGVAVVRTYDDGMTETIQAATSKEML